MTGEELLEQYKLGGRDFQKVDLTGASLRQANLRGADLGKALLREALLTLADLGGASLAGADLRGAHLEEANLEEASLDRASLAGAGLHGANLHGATAWWANLQRARLPGANLRRARLTDADLRGADLAGAHLEDADLTGADLTGANLAGANLTRCRLSWTRLEGADLSGIMVDRWKNERNDWRPEALEELAARSVALRIRSGEDVSSPPGLILRFHTRLTPLDRMLIEAVVTAVWRLTPTDCRVVPLEASGEQALRVEGSKAEHLCAIADLLYQRPWEQTIEPPLVQLLIDLIPNQFRSLSFLVDRAARFELWRTREGQPVRDRQWTFAPDAERAMSRLLAELLTEDELRRLMGPYVLRPLAGPPISLDRLASSAVQSLPLRRPREAIFMRLLRERPHRAPDIAFVARLFGVGRLSSSA